MNGESTVSRGCEPQLWRCLVEFSLKLASDEQLFFYLDSVRDRIIYWTTSSTVCISHLERLASARPRAVRARTQQHYQQRATRPTTALAVPLAC